MNTMQSSKNKLLTIGLPTFNGARFLRETLEQIAAQTFTDFLLVISDNASTDDTSAIAQEFVQRDARFRYFRYETKVLPHENYFTLLRNATTPYFIWRPDDDVWPANYLEELIALLEADKTKKLAVPKSVERFFHRNFDRVTEFKPWSAGDGQRMEAYFRFPETWMYGVFDRQAMVDGVERMKPYSSVRGWGFVFLFQFMFKNLVVGTNNTFFQWMGYVDQTQMRLTGQLRPETQLRLNMGARVDTPPAFGGRLGSELSILRMKTRKKMAEVDPLLRARREAFRLIYGWVCEEVKSPLRRLRWRLFVYRWLGHRIYEGRRAFKYKILKALLRSRTESAT